MVRFRRFAFEARDGSDLPSDAEILFSIPDEVQIFYITASGQVSCPSYPTSLFIFKFKDALSANSEDQPSGTYLKVGSWMYPLVPGQSPVLKSNLGKYMFPDLDQSASGNAVGLLLPDNLPADEAQVFDVILEQLTAAVALTSTSTTTVVRQMQQLQSEPNKEMDTESELKSYDEYMEFSTKLSDGMVKGAEFVGQKLLVASVKASEWMFQGTEFLRERIEPGTAAAPVDPRVKTGLEVAKWTASKAAQGSGFLVSKAGAATLALGRFIAPHIRQHGSAAISHFSKQDSQTTNKQLDIATEVAGGAVKAFSAIYMSLEHSSKILAQNLANNTVTIVTHRYGPEAGSVTENALSTAGNTYLTVYNTAALGPKGLAKRLAKNTGKVLVSADPEETPGKNRDQKDLDKV